MSSPQAGDTYRLNNPYGYGTGSGALPTQMLGVVEDVYPAGTAGVGSDGGDTVVLVVDDRRISVPLDQFDALYVLETPGGGE